MNFNPTLAVTSDCDYKPKPTRWQGLSGNR